LPNNASNIRTQQSAVGPYIPVGLGFLICTRKGLGQIISMFPFNFKMIYFIVILVNIYLLSFLKPPLRTSD
jgi:hypothetical protein